MTSFCHSLIIISLINHFPWTIITLYEYGIYVYKESEHFPVNEIVLNFEWAQKSRISKKNQTFSLAQIVFTALRIKVKSVFVLTLWLVFVLSQSFRKMTIYSHLQNKK